MEVSNEIDVQVKPSEFKFQKNSMVVLPMYIRRITSGGTVVKGVVLSDVPYYFEDGYYWPVQIKRAAAPRYRKVQPEADTLFVREDDLRLDVEHPLCPSCQCLTEAAQQALIPGTNVDNGDEDEEEEGEDEEEPFP